MSSTGNSPSNANPSSQQHILSQFESLMDALVRATSATLRSSAEQKLSEAKTSNLLLYLECLLQLTLNSSNNEIKQLSIVMFRQSCQPNNTTSDEWSKIPISAYNVFENGLLTAMSKETDITTYLLICDAIGTLASRIIPAGYWENLLSQLLELVNKANTYHKQGFLRVLDCLAEYCIEFLKPHFENIYKVINIAIRDENDMNIVLQAYKSFVSIVISIDNMNELNQWKDVIPSCINLLSKSKDEGALTQILSSTIDIVSHRFVLLKPLLDQLLLCVVKIARDDNLEFDSRKLAFEMLVAMSKQNALLLRQHDGYMKNVVELAMYYLSLYDDDISFDVIEDDIDQHYIWNARQWSNELASNLSGKAFLSVAQPIIKSGLESTNWKQCYSALQTFIQIIPFIKDIDGWTLDHENDTIWDILLPKIINLTTNKSVRAEIKHSALFLVRQLINNYQDSFCNRYHSMFYNSQIKILLNYKTAHYRVLIQCIKCISYFSKYSLISQFRDKSDMLLKQLLLMVTDGNLQNEKLKSNCITCVGSCSHVMRGQYFLPYYDKFMPICMDIIQNNKLAQIFRGKAMECIGMIGEAVGYSRFNMDAHKLMSLLLPYHKQLIADKNNKDNQIVYNYMNQLFARISRCIGHSFIQYFQFIIPSILHSASLEAAQILLPDQAPNTTNINNIDNSSVFTVHLRGIGDTKFCINPISLDEKDTACHMLYQFCKDQCVGFFPYVSSTANVMKSLMSYQYNARVRSAATGIIPLLLKCVILNKEQNNINNEHTEIFNLVFEPFMSALLTEPDVIETIPILEILGQIAAIIGDSRNNIWSFEHRHLSLISEILESLLTESQNRIKERILDELGEKLIIDEEKKEEIEWANDVELELISHIIDVIEYTFKASGETFTKYFIDNGLGQATTSMLNKIKNKKYLCSESEILQSICIFIDCIEYGGQLAAEKYINWFYPFLCDGIQFDDDDIKQTCIFGMGVLAKCGYLHKLDPGYKYFHQFLNDIQEFKREENENKQPEQDEDEYLSKCLIYENMISTVGKIIRYSSPETNTNNNNNNEILFNWIRLLPIENDKEEFNAMTENLLFFVEKYWNELIVNSEEMRERILFSLLFYLSCFKHETNITSYQLIMDYNVDISDEIPKNIPVLTKINIGKIKQLKSNPFLIKMKAFEKVMQKLQPQDMQNIQFVVNKY